MGNRCLDSMNEIKKQLLTEIKQRFGSYGDKDIKITDKKFPMHINNKHRKDSVIAKEKASEEMERGYHRGSIKKAKLPTSYRFKPTAFNKGKLSYSGYTESGVHEYNISGDIPSTMKIKHGKSKKPLQRKGSLTTSDVEIDFAGNKPTEELLQSMIPSLAHHINSHGPDTINLKTKDMKLFYDRLVGSLSSKYRVSSKESEDGTYSWTLQSKKITPKIQSLIKTLINK